MTLRLTVFAMSATPRLKGDDFGAHDATRDPRCLGSVADILAARIASGICSSTITAIASINPFSVFAFAAGAPQQGTDRSSE
jgi:hypothetical protein